ncbi:FAD-dependent monooxygenase [Amycolatopsis anabasis]|uniref:FAD-dependent monooxygenase n=1 Tax=Amycolatopsis anabasis TaxID=1840409 RepID=UPI00131B2AC5|nr:FAD-dependent monooxygenase [Amycolatopsis anabasis]
MDVQVLVSGAGPTGLTLALELARRGVGVRVVDKAAEYFAGSRGDGLQPRTLEVFDDLGVLDAVFAAGAPPAVTRVHLDGKFAGERRMAEWREPTPAVPYPNAWFLGQSRTEAILRDRLAEFGVRVELATELTAFEQDENGVTATLTRGGATETVRAAYLVGADGGRSFVRKALGIPFEGTTDESIRMLLGDVRVDGLDHDFGYWFARADEPMAGIGLTPLSGGDHFQFATPLDADDSSLATLQRLFEQYSGRSDLRLRDLVWSTIWRPNVRLAQRFAQGRVFLAGDAAHVHPPTGGQGLNTGVQDAYNLGWKLASGDPELLATYEAERLPVAARVLGVSSELLRKYTDGAADAHERGEETRQLDIGYRGSPLSRDDRARPGSVRAGDRAPDAPVADANGKQVRLFDLFRGPHATLLAFGGGPAEAEPGVHVHRVLRPGQAVTGDALVDVDGHAFAAYDVAEGTRVLVRPDGYLREFTAA